MESVLKAPKIGPHLKRNKLAARNEISASSFVSLGYIDLHTARLQSYSCDLDRSKKASDSGRNGFPFFLWMFPAKFDNDKSPDCWLKRDLRATQQKTSTRFTGRYFASSIGLFIYSNVICAIYIQTHKRTLQVSRFQIKKLLLLGKLLHGSFMRLKGFTIKEYFKKIIIL